MRPFNYERATGLAGATDRAGTAPSGTPPTAAPVQFLAGGTTILDLMKLDVMRPTTLIDLTDADPGARHIGRQGDTFHLSAFATMAEAASHPEVQHNYPVIVQSLDLAASPQLRNMATLGGNVLQRTRCNYFRDPSWPQCNKRSPGSGCAALDGVNRKHAVLGVSDACIAAYPGDFAQALVALDARIEIAGPGGQTRVIAAEALHLLPGDTPHIETTLAPGEIITGYRLPVAPWTRRSLYLKIRDRQSYEFALASAAVALDLDDGVVHDARIALGGVASKPWRAREAEAVLRGRAFDQAAAQQAAEAAFATATAHGGNAYKRDLGRRTMVRALLDAQRLEL